MNRNRINLKIILVLLAILSLPVFSLNLQKPGENPWVLRPFSMVAGFVQEAYMGFVGGIQNTTRTYINLVDINQQIKKLKEENSELKAKMLNFDDLNLENQRYREMLKFQDVKHLVLVPAQVIGQDIFAERSVVRISVGSAQGVKKGQAVVHPNGVVGYVLSSSLGSSVVFLVTDRYAVVDARVQRSRARGIVKGLNPTHAELVYLQRTDEVEIGDLVVSSGLDNIFPEGFPIARVDGVQKESSGITQEVLLRPVVDTSQLEEVFVVKQVLAGPPEEKKTEELSALDVGR